MFTQTIVPDSSSITLQLPEDFVGKQVTVIAVVEKKEYTVKLYEEKLKQIKETFAKLPHIDHTHYKFNREEANDFE